MNSIEGTKDNNILQDVMGVIDLPSMQINDTLQKANRNTTLSQWPDLIRREFSKKFNFQQHLLQHHRHVKPEDNDIKQVLACLRCLEKTFASYKELWQHLIACHKMPPRPPNNDILRLFTDNGLDIDSRSGP